MLHKSYGKAKHFLKTILLMVGNCINALHLKNENLNY
jgi:hypothetical protein